MRTAIQAVAAKPTSSAASSPESRSPGSFRSRLLGKPPASSSIAAQVEEGVMIVSAGVRMTIKNLVITRALREQVDYDPDWYGGATSDEFAVVAQEKLREAARVSTVRRTATRRLGRPAAVDDFRFRDLDHLKMRESIARELGEQLLLLSADEGFVRSQVELAHAAASDELSVAIRDRIISQIAIDPIYAEQRDERLEQLGLDIAELARDARERDGPAPDPTAG